MIGPKPRLTEDVSGRAQLPRRTKRGRPSDDGVRETAQQMHASGLSWPKVAKLLNRATGAQLTPENYRQLVKNEKKLKPRT